MTNINSYAHEELETTSQLRHCLSTAAGRRLSTSTCSEGFMKVVCTPGDQPYMSHFLLVTGLECPRRTHQHVNRASDQRRAVPFIDEYKFILQDDS
ncbi:hypothetical protein AVEN_28349-1 [Araneus ventricosus]|uniref:Uncharacterized protein n=1 Tax=Araneus ventricosus TaxID=182803 RepID=A0A4Y2FAL1_ARAVE|nr:hypothetical protein AVEN_28349-1 [Araneus ventricosus]